MNEVPTRNRDVAYLNDQLASLRRPRLAIISTYDELCGIAGYAQALATQLEVNFDVKVFKLDQYLLRNPSRRVGKLADDHVRSIAAELRGFDSVSIQLEYGTLGSRSRQIIRRFRCLVQAAPALSVTFHTIIRPELKLADIAAHLLRLRFQETTRSAFRVCRETYLSRASYGLLRRAQKSKPVSLITHTARDKRLLRDVYNLGRVYDHPLSYFSAAQASEIRGQASRRQFPILESLPENAKLVGTFGFLSPYKGFATAIRAMRYLPPEYHLLVFGGVHPQQIKTGQFIDPYVGSLLDEASDAGVLKRLRAKGNDARADAVALRPLERRKEAEERIHFMGALSDREFLSGMAICDVVVLPYIEVGQSASAPVSQALELGCRVIVARTHAFMEFGRYHPDALEYFDTGNHVELAQRIRSRSRRDGDHRALTYNTTTNTALYVRANTPSALRNSGDGEPKVPQAMYRPQGSSQT